MNTTVKNNNDNKKIYIFPIVITLNNLKILERNLSLFTRIQTLINRKLIEFIHNIYHCDKTTSRIDFIKNAISELTHFFDCDYSTICTFGKTGFPCVCYDYYRKNKNSFVYNLNSSCFHNKLIEGFDPETEEGCQYLANGTFLISDTDKFIYHNKEKLHKIFIYGVQVKAGYKSLLFIPLTLKNENVGILSLMSRKKDSFTCFPIDFFEELGKMVLDAFSNRVIYESLHERVKELSCLYRISKLSEKKNISIDQLLEESVALLPPAFLYPEFAAARIKYNGHAYQSSNYKENMQNIRVPIMLCGQEKGILEICYARMMPIIDESPFLQEEMELLRSAVKQIVLIIENIESEREKAELQEQLRHADRLATVGQLAAGVAHELNEPIGNILGFAQLIQKETDITDNGYEDLQKIVKASIHAREIVKKLLLFSRQVATEKNIININSIIKDSLFFFNSRCENQNIKILLNLDKHIPEICGDPSQMNQVIVNLLVNAIQAIKKNGEIRIKTEEDGKNIFLFVKDNGAGMSKETKDKIFIPFFTTKSVGEGTGLGLPVIHGIVTSHGGVIEVSSEIGQGSEFKISFPKHITEIS